MAYKLKDKAKGVVHLAKDGKLETIVLSDKLSQAELGKLHKSGINVVDVVDDGKK